MKLIAGLGNPGREYERTPHNVGFRVADLLADRLHATWSPSRRYQAMLAKATLDSGETLLLVKPTTYMNRSGDAIAPLLRYHNGTPGDLNVILDDVNLPVGRLRLRPNGSAGGHNGLASLIERLGTADFPRIRIGVGAPPPGRDLAGYVLGSISPAMQEILDQVFTAAADAALAMLNGLTPALSTRFNGWQAPGLSPETP